MFNQNSIQTKNNTEIKSAKKTNISKISSLYGIIFKEGLSGNQMKKTKKNFFRYKFLPTI